MTLLSVVGYILYTIIVWSLVLMAGIILLVIIYLKLYKTFTLRIYKGKQDMSGKTVLITGATSGIGKATAHDLAKRNARVLIACRDLNKARKVAEEIKASTGNPNVMVKHLDLTSFKSVRKCAQDIISTEEQLHVLINNAGIGGNVDSVLTEDGCEIMMQTNYLGHFLLTLLLLNLLKKSSPSRIINIASELHRKADANLQNFDFASGKELHPLVQYGNSNLVRILFTRELAERLFDTGVTVNTLHPGYVNTNIFDSGYIIGVIVQWIVILTGKTCEEGAQTIIRLAVDPTLETISGKYFRECKIGEISKAARNKELGRRLFKLSERAVGVSFSEIPSL